MWVQVDKKGKPKRSFDKKDKYKLLGAYETLAVTDTTERYEKTNVAKPSDFNVEEARDWVNHNKK